MKYKRIVKRVTAFILMLAICLSCATPQYVQASDFKSGIDLKFNNFNGGKVALTKLPKNTWSDWTQAYEDGIGYPGFFHNAVEDDIR